MRAGRRTSTRSPRLLSLAAVRDGMDRGSAAKIGGMDRQTLRDWVHRFNASGPDGLIIQHPRTVPCLARSPEVDAPQADRIEAIGRIRHKEDRSQNH